MQYIITANKYQLEGIGIDFDISGYKAIPTGLYYNSNYIQVLVKFEGIAYKFDIPRHYLQEMPEVFEIMTPFAHVLEMRYKDSPWRLYYNKKAYDTIESAQEALVNIKNDCPFFNENYEFRIRPIYIGYVND
jgi:hypothetical protein